MLCLDFLSPFSESSIFWLSYVGTVNISRVLGAFCKQRVLKNVKRCYRAHCLTLRDSSYHSHTFFWKRTPESFLSIHLLWTLSGSLSPTTTCCASASKISVWPVVALTATGFSRMLPKKSKETAWRTLLCKCRKRVRQQEQVKCRFAEEQERNASVQTPLRCSDLNMCTTAPTWKQLIQNIGIFVQN